MVTIYINIDERHFVTGWGSTYSENSHKLVLEKNHDFFSSDIHCWEYVDGELRFDEEEKNRLLDEFEKEQNKLSADELNTLALFELAQEIEALRIENQELRGGVMK